MLAGRNGTNSAWTPKPWSNNRPFALGKTRGADSRIPASPQREADSRIGDEVCLRTVYQWCCLPSSRRLTRRFRNLSARSLATGEVLRSEAP
jgi:hypothetical protein